MFIASAFYTVVFDVREKDDFRDNTAILFNVLKNILCNDIGEYYRHLVIHPLKDGFRRFFPRYYVRHILS